MITVRGRHRVGDAGVVEQHVDRAVDGRDGGVDRLRVGEVGLQEGLVRARSAP